MQKKYNPEDFSCDAIRVAEFEELVLLAIASLNEGAYGIAIQQRLQEAGRQVSVGALYSTLQRLQNKRAIHVSQRSQPTGKRGGRCKVYFELTRVGQGALEYAEQVRSRLRTAAAAAEPIKVAAAIETSAVPLLISSPQERKSTATANPVAVSPKTTVPSPVEESPSPPPRPDFLPYYGE